MNTAKHRTVAAVMGVVITVLLFAGMIAFMAMGAA